MRRWILPLLTCLLALLCARRAEASNFQVSPIAVSLSATTTSSLLTLSNHSSDELRFQVKGYSWDESPTGEMKLNPSNDVVFYPAMLKLAPGEVRKLRVGMNVTPGATEKTYRIFVEELPPLTSTNDPATVRVLTRMGVPVFVQPALAAAAAVPQIQGTAVSGDKIRFSVKNAGNAHMIAQKIRLVAKNAAGQPVWTHEFNGWYILAGGARDFDVTLPKTACAAKTIDLEVVSDTSRTVNATLSNPTCTP